jgi:hypothetical protein
VNDLLSEAQRLPEASIKFARGVSHVRTPEHLIPLRTEVRETHRGQLLQLHEQINRRFGTTGASDDYVNVFYAASEMALMEWVGRKELPDSDRRSLRNLWEALLYAT